MILKVGLIFVLFWSGSFVDPIVWTKNRKLTWSDFQSRPVLQFNYIAQSKVEIQYESAVDKAGKMTMRIETFFKPDQSWVKQEQKSDEILKHEQYHFNLAEIWARKIRKEVMAKKWNAKKLEKDFNALFKNHINQLHKEQARYDDETNHAKELAKQAMWEKKIDGELNELQKFTTALVPFSFE